ncbi:MAG TPA: cupin domain-containing protein [Candidatus Acidoferrales bacterium]|nr:cupin domain-containing protein [Candidatus Acidoferrales bacterium]
MFIRRFGVLSIGVFLLISLSTLSGQTPKTKATKPSMGGMVAVAPGTETWGDIPAAALVGTPSVDMGGTFKLAVVQGDPMTPGRSFTVHLSCTDGAKFASHWHPTTENVTVLKGSVRVGMGPKWDDASMSEMGAGGFASVPAHMIHYAQCKGDTVLQVHGIAPFVVNFVDANGDPKPTK